jgi:hypothetical protein
MLLASSLPPLDAAPLIAVPRPIDDILSPKLRHLLSYWGSKREGRALPARRKLAPEDMVEMLPRVGLIDVIRPPLRFRYRLLGGEIELLAHGLKTGAMLDDIRSPSYRDNDRIHFAAAVDTARPSVHRIAFERHGRRTRIERLVLPLWIEDPSQVAMLLIGIDRPAGLNSFFDSRAA